MEARGRLPGPGPAPSGTGELPGGRPARGRRPGAPDTGRGGFGRVRLESHRTRPERRRRDGGSRAASCRGPRGDRRGRAWPCGRPTQAGRTARLNGATGRLTTAKRIAGLRSAHEVLLAVFHRLKTGDEATLHSTGVRLRRMT